MSSARKRTAMSYYSYPDTYSMPQILRNARSKFDQSGLPLATDPIISSNTPGSMEDGHENDPHSDGDKDEDSRFMAQVSSCTGMLQMALRRIWTPLRRLLSANPSALGSSSSVSPTGPPSTLLSQRGSNGSGQVTSLMRVKPQDLESGLISQESNFVLSTRHNEIEDHILGHSVMSVFSQPPQVRCYQIQPESSSLDPISGSESRCLLDVLEIALPYKKTIFENFLAEKRDLRSMVLSEKCACLIWIWSENTRIVLITESAQSWSLKQWYRQILSDMALTDSILIGHPYFWHPVVRRRLNRAMKHFKRLYEIIEKQEVGWSTSTSASPSSSTANLDNSTGDCVRPVFQAAPTSWTKLEPDPGHGQDEGTCLSSASSLRSLNSNSAMEDEDFTQLEYVDAEKGTKVIVTGSSDGVQDGLQGQQDLKDSQSQSPGQVDFDLRGKGSRSGFKRTSRRRGGDVDDLMVKWKEFSRSRKARVDNHHGHFMGRYGGDSKSNNNYFNYNNNYNNSMGPRETLDSYMSELTEVIGDPPDLLSLGSGYKIEKITRNVSTVVPVAPLCPIHQPKISVSTVVEKNQSQTKTTTNEDCCLEISVRSPPSNHNHHHHHNSCSTENSNPADDIVTV